MGTAIVLLGMAIPSDPASHVQSWFLGGGVIWFGCFLIADALVAE